MNNATSLDICFAMLFDPILFGCRLITERDIFCVTAKILMILGASRDKQI